jgi:hypothetical protein
LKLEIFHATCIGGIAAVTTLGFCAERITPLAFELLLIVIGAGFGPMPSLTAGAMQNVVDRHQLVDCNE